MSDLYSNYMAAIGAVNDAFGGGGDGGGGGGGAPLNNRQNNRINTRANQAGQNKVEQYKDLQDASRIVKLDTGSSDGGYIQKLKEKSNMSYGDAQNILYNYYSGNSNLSQQDVSSMAQKQAAFTVGRQSPVAAAMLNGVSSADFAATAHNNYETAKKATQLLNDQIEQLKGMGATTYDSFGGGVLNQGYDKNKMDDLVARRDRAAEQEKYYKGILQDALAWDEDTKNGDWFDSEFAKSGSHSKVYQNISDELSALQAEYDELAKLAEQERLASMPGPVENQDPNLINWLALRPGEKVPTAPAAVESHENSALGDKLRELEAAINSAQSRKNYAERLLINDKAADYYIQQGKQLIQKDIEATKAERAATPGVNAPVAEGNENLTVMPTAVDVERSRDNFEWKLPTNEWTKEQESTFYYLAANFGTEAAYQYAVDLNNAYNEQASEAEIAKAEKAGRGYSIKDSDDNILLKQAANAGLGAAGLVGQVAATPLHILSWVDKMGQAQIHDGYNVSRRDPFLTDRMNAFVGGRASQLNEDYGTIGGKGMGDLYQLAISSAQSLALGNLAGEGATLALFFGQAADSAYDEAINRGASTQQAAIYSLLSGSAEVLGEKISLENLLDADAAATRSMLKNILVQSGLEGSEEAFTDLLNVFSDAISAELTGNRTQLQNKRLELLKQGLSAAEADKRIMKDFLSEVAFDFLGGALSAGMSVPIQSGINNLSVKSNTRQISEQVKAADQKRLEQNKAAIQSGEFRGIFSNQLMELAKAAYRQGDTASFEKIIAEFTARAENGQLENIGLNLDFGADTQRLANALREQLETAAVQEAREGYVDSFEYDEAGRPIPEEEERAPVPDDSEEGYRNQNEIFGQMQARSDEAAVAQQRAQALARQQEEQNRQALQQQADAGNPLYGQAIQRNVVEQSGSNEKLAELKAKLPEMEKRDSWSDLRKTLQTSSWYEWTNRHSNFPDTRRIISGILAGGDGLFKAAKFYETAYNMSDPADQTKYSVASKVISDVLNILDNNAKRDAWYEACDYWHRTKREASTNTTGTGTIEASNTQEVANGQSAVQEPAAGAGEIAGRETEREVSPAEIRPSQDAGRLGQESPDSAASPKPKVRVAADGSHVEDIPAGTPLRGIDNANYDAEADSLKYKTTEGTRIVRKASRGTRAYTVQQVASTVGLSSDDILVFENDSGYCYDPGDVNVELAFYDPDSGKICFFLHGDADTLDYLDQYGEAGIAATVVHEYVHKKLDEFIKQTDSIPEFIRRAKTVADIYRSAAHNAGIDKFVGDTSRFFLRDLGYRGYYLADPDVRKTINTFTDAKQTESLLEDLSLEEGICEAASYGEYFAELWSKTKLQNSQKHAFRSELYTALKDAGVLLDSEAGSIESALSGEYSADEAISRFGQSGKSSRGNPKPRIAKSSAINKAASGDTRYISSDDLRSVLEYTLDRASPGTTGDSLAERAASVLLDYYDEASDGTIGSLNKSQSKNLIATLRNVLNELDARGAKINERAESTVSEYANNFGIDEIENGGNLRTRDKMTIEQRQDEFGDGATRSASDYEYEKWKKREDLDALQKAEDYERKGRGKWSENAEKGTNYLKGNISETRGKHGWVEHSMPSKADIDEARTILQRKGENASIEERGKLLQSHKQWLESVAAEMRSLRGGFYGSENIEQRKADLGYIADGIKEQISQLDADIGYLTDELNLSLESNPESNEAISLSRALEEAETLKGRLENDIESLRDEYRHLNSEDDPALRNIRSLIDSISAEMDELGSKLSKSKDSSDYLFKKAKEEQTKAQKAKENGDEFWAESYRRSANEFRVAAEKQKRRENWAKRTLFQADVYNKGSIAADSGESNSDLFVKASESLQEREPFSPGDQALFESHIRGGSYVPSTASASIRNSQTDEANRIVKSASQNIDSDVQQQSSINKRNAERAKADEELNEKLAAQIREDYDIPQKPTPKRRVTEEDLQGFDIAREMRQGFTDRRDDFTPSSRSMKDPSGFRTSRAPKGKVARTSSADILSGETYTAAEGEQTQQRAKPAPDGVSALRQSMEKILNGEGDLFRAETEADQAPVHDDTDDPRHKLTKKERQAQRQRVGESPSDIKPVSADVVQGMLHVQEAVKGILDSNSPVRHVMNLANSITDFSADGHEMNWLATKEIKQTADDIKAIFEDGHIENDQKAQMMAEATVKLMNQVAARTARAEMFRKLGFEFTEHANKNGTGNMDAKGLKAFNQWAKSMQLNPTTAFKMVDGFDAGGNGIGYQIARQIQDSVALEQMLTASVHGQYHKLAGMEGLQDFVEGKSKSPVTVPGVGTITEQQAVEFIKSIRTLANQKIGNKSRLETITGFTFVDKNGNRKEVKKSNFKSGEESSFFEDMRRLENEMLVKLSPAARKYLEITDDILFDLGKRVSKTKQQVTGVGFADFRKGDYYPVKYGRSERTTDYTDSGEQSGIFDPFTDRTRKIGGYVEIGSAADTVDRYIQRSVYAAAYGDLADELQFLNSSALGMRGMANSAGDSFGKSYARLFNNYANDVAGINTKDQSGAAEAFKKGRLALQQGALRFSISVPIKQVASYWDAAGILSPEALVNAYRFKGAGAKGLGAENQLLAYRKVGNIDPTLSERLNEKGYVSELKKKSGVVRAFDLATNTMDYRTVDNLFTATIVDTHMAFPEMDVNSKQFKDIVAARFQDVVLQTQPVFNRNARSENQRTSNELVRMVSMFRTQQTQNYNRIVTALGEARAAKGTKLEAAANKQLKQTITGQVLASMEFGLLSIVADMARHKLKPYRKDDDDDRISAEKIMKRFALNSIESAAGTVWFGDQVAKAMIDIAAGDSSDSGGEFYGLNFGMLSSMGSALNGTVETAGTIAKAIRTGDWSKVSLNNLRYAVTNAAQVFGIPANNVANLINSLAMYSLDAVDYATGHKSGNRGVYDNALKMFDDMLRGDYTSNTAKHQADKFFRTGDAENLLYNIALLEQDGREKAEKAGGDDPHKGHNYLANLLGTDEAKSAEVDEYGRKLSANERIANYLVDSDLDAEAIDAAVNEYANSGGYNVFYNALRAQGMNPADAVNELYKSDNKAGMTTQIYDEDNVNLLLSGVDAPGDTYDVPPLEQRNLDEYVDYATAAKVYIETKNYDELDKLIDSYNDLDENTRAVLEAKDSNLIHLRECSDLGIGSAEYYGLKDTMKDVQVEMDKSTATGSPLKLIAMGRADLTDKQRAALLESDWMGISKTGKTVYTTLSKYGMSMEDVGQWLNKADYSWEDSNGTLSNIEVAQALRNTPSLTDSQRRAIYEELKPLLTNPHKINDWGRYTYDSEIAYIDKKGLEVGKWD